MTDLVVALDETAGTRLLQKAEAATGTITKSGSGSLGPFTAGYSASAYFTNGTMTLSPPKTVQAANVRLNFSIDLSFSFDVNDILPPICLPQGCIDTHLGEVCTPKICVPWPSVTVPVHYPPQGGRDHIDFSVDFDLVAQMQGSTWLVDIEILGIPFLQLTPIAAALLIVIGAAIGAALSVIPFIGPFIGIVVAAVIAAIALAGVVGLLGLIITPFIAGRKFQILSQPQRVQLIPPGSPVEPAVDISITALSAAVTGNGKNELVVTADLAP